MSNLHDYFFLSDQSLELILSFSSEVSLKLGDTLLSEHDELDALYILLKGRLRQTSSHPLRDDNLFSLAVFSPPFIAGLASFHAGQSIETLSAVEDSVLLKISIKDWIELLLQSSELKSYFSNIITQSDIWPLVKNYQQYILPPSAKLLKSSLISIAQTADVELYDSNSKLVLSEDRLYFIANNTTRSYAKLVTKNDLPLVTSPGYLRLVSIDSSLLNQQDSYNFVTSSIPNSLSTSLISESAQNYPSNKSLDQSILTDTSQQHSYRHYDCVPGAVPEAVSCFRSIADVLNLPLKTDLLRRTLEDASSSSEGKISLSLCAAIGESLGLKSQLLKLPAKLTPRLNFPAFIEFNTGELCAVLAIKNAQLLISRPLYGIESFTPSELSSFVDDDDNFKVLVFQKTDRTPQSKFNLQWFYPALKKHKRSLIEVLIASFFVQLFQLMNPLIIQQIIDKVIGQNGMSTLPVLAVLLFSFSVFENILTAVRTNLFIDTTNRIDISLGEQVIDHLFRLPLTYFDKRPVGELSSRLSELEQIRSFLTGTALTVIMDSIFSFLYVIIMLFYSWVLTIVALLVAPILAFLTFSISPIIRDQLRTKAKLNAHTQNHLIEVLTGIQTVKAQNFELKARWRWKERYSKYVSHAFKNAVTATTTNGLTAFLNQISSLSVLCVGAYLVLRGDLSLGQLIAFRIISGYVTSPLLRLSNLYQSFQRTSISLERLADIVDTPQESTDIDKKNIPMPQIAGSIDYEDVSFRFSNSGPLQLSNLSLHVNPGEFVAIVGQSGSGKSTLTKLLTRLYEPNSGRILVDSLDINKVELYSLRSQVGIVPQDSLLFEGSVQENIALSNPEATSEEIIAAAKVACAHEFIMALPSGYASSVGERGTALSGGQRQRIAIARTVLQNPRLLIMDEATSALDYQTEKLVSLNLMEHFRGRTVLFITHRLNSIVHSDKIVLLHQGQVDEVGTHSSLLDLKGRYYALFSQQSSN